MIQLHIPLPPTPWAASVKGEYVFFDPKEKEKRCVRFYIKQQYSDCPIADYVVIEFKFIFNPPKSASKKKRKEMLEGKIIPTKCDCTNLQKLYEDCLKEIVITDDRNVAKIFSEKLYGEKEEVYIKVFTLEEYNHVHSSGRS